MFLTTVIHKNIKLPTIDLKLMRTGNIFLVKYFNYV